MMTLDEAIRECEEVGKLKACKECSDEYFQLAEWLKELKERRERSSNGNYRDGQACRRFVLGENIYAVLMLEIEANGRFNMGGVTIEKPSTGIILRLVIDKPEGEKERLDVVMSNAQTMGIRKALKQQVKRNGGWEKKREEGDD